MTTKFLKKTSDINNSLEFTDSDWNMFMMMFMFILMIPVIENIQIRPQYQGVTEEYNLDASTGWKEIDLSAQPWSYCEITNSSTENIYYALNTMDNEITVSPRTRVIIDRITAAEKISKFYYKTDPGIVAQFKVVGEY